MKKVRITKNLILDFVYAMYKHQEYSPERLHCEGRLYENHGNKRRHYVVSPYVYTLKRCFKYEYYVSGTSLNYGRRLVKCK